VLKVYERASRTITASADAWHRSGDLLAEMARKLEIARVSKAFANAKSSSAVSHLQDLEVIQVEPRDWEFQGEVSRRHHAVASPTRTAGALLLPAGGGAASGP
jgi:hypothetical protein